MEILYKSENAIVVYKEPAVPSQPDPSGDKDAITLAAAALFNVGESTELFLIHRLDRVIGGLMIFARNKRAAAQLSSLVSGDGIGKEYLAVIDGYIDSGNLTDYLYKDARKGKAFAVKGQRHGVKFAELSFETIDSKVTDRGTKTLVKIKLKTGRFHQIRAQFSSRGLPISGDGKYGSKDSKANFPALFAYRLSLELFGEKIEISKLPDKEKYPWNIFDWSKIK